MNVARFRRDYDGEFIITEVKISSNRTTQTREWVPNAITNQHVSPRAVVVGGHDPLNRFDFRKLKNNKGGLLAKKALQTYGTADLWKEMSFHFFVTTESSQINSMIKSGYTKDNIVFTTSKICIDNPGHFYPVPYLPAMDQLAQAVYLAAFDEHTEVFLINYNIETPAGTANWIEDVNTVIRVYDTVKFILVGTEAAMPRAWRSNRNCSVMGIRDFITHCDI